jgi:Subtilisin inhibitor-like
VRSLVAVAGLLLFLAAACSDSGSAKDLTIDLRIAVWPQGRGSEKPVRRFHLHCNPLRGNLPHGDRACYDLAVTSRPFAPVPRDKACTQIYGGPQVARVLGRLRGRLVDATFRRTNGCETARWERVAFLFPVRT